MRTVKKGLAMLVVVLMLISLLPAAVLAEEQPGETEAPVETVAPEATEQVEATAVPVEDGEDSASEPQEGENEPAENTTSPEPEETPAEGETETSSETDTVVSDETQAEGDVEVEGEQSDDSTDVVEEETDAEAADAEATEGEETEEADEEEQSEPSYALSSIGVTVGGTYVPVSLSGASGASEVQPASLLPLQERYGTLDLSGFFPDELKSVTLQTVLSNTEAYPSITGSQIAWAKGSSFADCTNFRVLGSDGVIDLSPVGSSSTMYMQIISGPNAADQTEPRNVRYLVTVYLPSVKDLFSFNLSSASGETIQIKDSYYSSYNNSYSITVDEDQANEETVLGFVYNGSGIQGATLDGLYAGKLTEAEVSSATPIDGMKYKANYFKYPGQQFTAVLSKGASKMVTSFSVSMSWEYNGVSVYYEGLYDSRGNYAAYSSRSSWENSTNVYTVMVGEGHTVSEEYLVRFQASYRVGNKIGAECIERAVVGHYTSLSDAQKQTDIKAQLFGSGYKANYGGDGVEFSIFDILGEVEHYRIKTADYAPTPSIDTYFQITGAKRADKNTQNGENYEVYYISDKDIDSEGAIHQTVLIMDQGKPVTDETICPVFRVSRRNDGQLINVYQGLDKTSGEIQKSGETAVPFKSGVAIPYSAAAEDGKHLQNYWVTFITPQTGAKLFVNGTNEESVYDETEHLPKREIHMGDLVNPDEEYHDVLVTNVGDTPLTGLYVRLEDAQNVQLDPYWTILDDGTRKLGAFTDTESRTENGGWVSYGELPNFARIRLLPLYDENGNVLSGVVSGYLIIGSDNGGEVKIKLTGSAGRPKIVTEKIRDGVKFVPYNSLIQTNNTGATDAIRLELVKENGDTGLPDGVKMYPNGELYGVPQKDGDYSFHIKLISNETNKELDGADFTMKVTLNTDDNVWNASDAGYGVLDPVGELTSGSGEGLDGSQHYMLSDYVEQVFRSEGSYGYFVGFYLDGQKLVSGTDYTSHEGSTVITIVEQTLTNAGKGTHTIAAEFHEQSTSDGTPHGTLKNTAQNYTINVEPKYTPTPKPTATPAPKPTNTPKPSNTDNSGNAGSGTSGSGPNSGNTAASPVAATVTCQVYLVDGANNPLANYPLELHSTPIKVTTTSGGFATFSGVSFGSHTLHALGTTGKSVASKTFTLASGQPAVNGDTITIQPGASVKMTMRLNGNTLELVSAEVGTPSTGDETPVALYLGMLCAASLALGYVVLRWKKEKDTQR